MITSPSDKIKVSVDGHVATLTIDNPAANTWDTESLPALGAIVEALNVDATGPSISQLISATTFILKFLFFNC